MQSQENSRELPYGDVGLPASAGISLCEIAEPLVVVKLCGGEAANSPVDCSSTPCAFAALRQNAGHAFGPQARLTPHCAKIAFPGAMLSYANTPFLFYKKYSTSIYAAVPPPMDSSMLRFQA